jgi:hypothetical protein
MSEVQAATAHLRRQRTYLGTWLRSVQNMLNVEPRNTKRHGELIAEQEMLTKELRSISRDLRCFM